MKLFSVLKMSGLACVTLMTLSGCASQEKVRTIDAACEIFQPIIFAAAEEGESDLAANVLDTDETVKQVDAFNRDLAALCGQP